MHCNILNLLGLNFDFCDFCAFLRLYQYYEFAAIDKPLNEKDMRALRNLSSRAQITPTSFVNKYHWGDFKGNPLKLVEKYLVSFDQSTQSPPWN